MSMSTHHAQYILIKIDDVDTNFERGATRQCLYDQLTIDFSSLPLSLYLFFSQLFCFSRVPWRFSSALEMLNDFHKSDLGIRNIFKCESITHLLFE